jgi:hypothetical protein
MVRVAVREKVKEKREKPLTWGIGLRLGLGLALIKLNYLMRR